MPGGGDICANLDVAGAPVVVENPDAGTLDADVWLTCYDGNSPAMLVASVDEAPTVPAGYEVLYVLTSGWDLVIQNVNTSPVFEVSQFGAYRIHTLVYNPATLDLGIVEIGVTTGFDVNGLLVQGGGDVCASLDVHGALIYAAPQWLCDLINGFYHNATQEDVAVLNNMILAGPDNAVAEAEKAFGKPAMTAQVYPNPTLVDLNLVIEAGTDMQLFLQVTDQMGRVVMDGSMLNATEGTNRFELSTNSLEAGMYTIQLIKGDMIESIRFVKQ